MYTRTHFICLCQFPSLAMAAILKMAETRRFMAILRWWHALFMTQGTQGTKNIGGGPKMSHFTEGDQDRRVTKIHEVTLYIEY